MINKINLVKSLKIWLVFLLAILTILIISTTTLAYFNFLKVYEGAGNLPKLNISYSVSGGNVENLRNITYTGQSSNDITVILSTYENNISGYVRAKVAISWSNSLNNTPYNDNNELVKACDVKNTINENLWEYKNGYYYLKTLLEKDKEVVLFNQVSFADGITTYRGERVSIYILAEIYQTTNLPENW